MAGRADLIKSRASTGAIETGDRLPLAELVAALILGAIGLAVDTKVGVFTWSIGILLAVNQMRTEKRFEERFSRLDTLSDVVDLSQGTDVDELRRLIEAYIQVNEPELQTLKATTVNGARDGLLRLAREKSSGELERTEYYTWLLPMIETAPAGSKIRALSLMLEVEWDDSELERKFIDQNVSAATRGVLIDRVFVMRRSDLPGALTRPEIRTHAVEEEPKHLRGHFVDLDVLEMSDKSLADRLGDGFIAFDERVALVDLHSIDGTVRGEVTVLDAEKARLRQLHDALLLNAEPLSLQLGAKEQPQLDKMTATESGTEPNPQLGNGTVSLNLVRARRLRGGSGA